jgi:hypothetical protein
LSNSSAAATTSGSATVVRAGSAGTVEHERNGHPRSAGADQGNLLGVPIVDTFGSCEGLGATDDYAIELHPHTVRSVLVHELALVPAGILICAGSRFPYLAPLPALMRRRQRRRPLSR